MVNIIKGELNVGQEPPSVQDGWISKQVGPRRLAPTPVVPAREDDAPPAPSKAEVEMAAEIANTTQPSEQRLNVRFTPEGYSQLQALARRGEKTVSETVRDAISLLGWLDDQMREGGQLLIKQKDGQMLVVAKPRR